MTPRFSFFSRIFKTKGLVLTHTTGVFTPAWYKVSGRTLKLPSVRCIGFHQVMSYPDLATSAVISTVAFEGGIDGSRKMLSWKLRGAPGYMPRYGLAV
jgi:hypothetical protein